MEAISSTTSNLLVQQTNSHFYHTPEQVSLSTPSSIIDLIEVVNRRQLQNHPATPEEHAALAGWMGWGPLAPAFESFPKGKWAHIRARLAMLLGPEGMQAASAATPTSFFTAPYIAETIWKLATGLGFSGGRVLEPGCGNGAVLAAAPQGLPLAFTGIEREPFTAHVAQLRFPQATILTSALEKVSLVNSSFDLVVGNVPFSRVHVYDRDAPIRFSLHNYFIWRSLLALRPGGLALLVTSRYTLDARNDEQREVLVGLGSLLGAIRLPSKAHQEAHTDVVTDILILQRKNPDVLWQGYDWSTTTTDAIPGIAVNQYFQQQPQSIVGTPTLDRGMYADHELIVHAPEDLPAVLTGVVDHLVNEARSRGGSYLPPIDRTILSSSLVRRRDDGFKEGSYHLIDNRLVQIVDGHAQPVTKMIAELTSLVHLRDAAITLLEAERDLDRPDAELLPLRRKLHASYDAYYKTYGAIHRAKLIVGAADPETGEQGISRRRPAAMYAFSQDPDYCIVLGLEEYDDISQQARKAPIFSQRVHTRPQRKSQADTPGEALALCLDEHGTLDLTIIGKLLGIPEGDVPSYLGDLIYEDPKTGIWQTASEYLSGNVRTKLDQALQAAKNDPERFGRNVRALESVIPEDVLPEEIKVLLGAPWIAPADIEQFCLETFGMRPVVSHERLTSGWEVTAPSGCRTSAAATSEWGTQRVNAYRLVEHGLNKTIPVVYDLTEADTRVKNVEESLAAQEKLRVIQARFGDWVWEETERATRLASVYNRIYNSIVPRTYDGSHLTFPGMSEQWQNNLYPWQKDFVWRMVSSPSALCGHPVGAGKTTTEIAGAMTLRRMGLTNKAAIIVPNHLLEQITAEAQRLYPGAHILMVSREDLSRDRRKLFAARIATGNYDVVVMTHSGLSAIGVHPETEQAYIEKRVAAYKEALLALDENDSHSKYSVKKLETAIEHLRQRQQQLLDKPHDDGVTFEQLGISYLIVDEAHLYKNLGLPTNIQGLQVKPSKRATDLEMKLRWLEEHNQGKAFASFFTATPLSNSMVEAYVLAWYLAQGHLFDADLRTLDAFASVFLEFQTRVEVSPNGGSFRLHTRPARFINLPEFLTMFTQFADLRGPEILSSKRPQRLEHTITIEPSEAIQAYVNDLVGRSERIQQGRPDSIAGKMDNMLWITTSGRMAALDLSLVGLPQEHSPKLEVVARTMLEVYRRWQAEASYLDGEHKSLQIGFCDLGTPNKDGDQVYGKLKRLLISGGMPASAIRYIHEAKTDSAKAHLFQQCRSGQVAVLLGSTSMLGTGTNIQNRCAAIHHIDAPWRPDEVEQREGRGLRPGNVYPVVELFRYVQQRTFDAYSWQTLTNKAVFFDQMRSGKIKGRDMEELGDAALSYGQVKAAATGDPLVLEQADLSVTITHLQRLRSAHLRARKRDAQEAATARTSAANARSRAAILQEIATTTAKSTVPGFVTARGLPIADRTEIGDFIAQRVLALLSHAGGKEWLGRWSDTKIWLQVSNQGKAYLVDLLVGSSSESASLRLSVSQEWLAKGQHWRFAHAIEQRIERAAPEAERELAAVDQFLGRAKDFEGRSREPFAQEEELTRRVQRKTELDAYTSLAAAAKQDAKKQEELAILRAQLLADAPAEVSDLPVAHLVKLAPPRRLQVEQTPIMVSVTAESVVEEPTVSRAVPAAVESVLPDMISGKTAVRSEASPVRSKSTLVFGNENHILLARKRQKKAKSRAKPVSKKASVQMEFPAMLITKEQAPNTKEEPTGPMQHTLWELI